MWTSCLHLGRIFNVCAQKLNGRFVYRSVFQDTLGLCLAPALIAGAGHTLHVWVIYQFELLSTRLLFARQGRAPGWWRSHKTTAATDGFSSHLDLACPAKMVPDVHACAGLAGWGITWEICQLQTKRNDVLQWDKQGHVGNKVKGENCRYFDETPVNPWGQRRGGKDVKEAEIERISFHVLWLDRGGWQSTLLTPHLPGAERKQWRYVAPQP